MPLTRLRLLGAFALFALSCPAQSVGKTFVPAERGGFLLPSGYLSARGSQIVGAQGNSVRIASVGWYGTDGPAGYGMQGLWAVSYQSILDSIKADGFNTVRIPWSNVNLDVQPVNVPATGTIDFKANPDLVGLTTRQIFQKVVAYAGRIGLKVIFDHHTDDGSGGQQPNGLWFDKGPGTDGTDGAGVRGTVDAARFLADWVRFAKMFSGNSTVIGFDLDNEPHGASWGGGGPKDIHQMFQKVGNAIQAVNPGALIICEPSQDWKGATPEGDVTLKNITSLPVVLDIPNKVVYSVHEYPAEIGGGKPAAAAEFITRMNLAWGNVVKHNIAPVWIGEMGSNMTSADSKTWAKILLDYMNGRSGAQDGPTFTSHQQPVSGSWWNIGSEGGRGNPDGNQTQWGAGHYKPEQQAVTDQMLFRPSRGLSRTIHDGNMSD